MTVPVIETWLVNGSTGPSATLTCNKPSGVATGDLLVLIPFNENASSTAQFTNNKSGWTFVKNCGNTTSDCHIGLFWRIADGTEGSSETVTATTAEAWGMWYLRISGVDASDVVEATGSSVIVGSAASIAITGVTTVESDCLVLYFHSFDGGDGFPFSVAGTGFAEVDDYQTGTSGSVDVSASFGYRDMATPGASGTATVTASSTDGFAGYQIAFNSSSGAPPATKCMIVS